MSEYEGDLKLDYIDEEYIKLLSFLLSHKISRKLGIKLTMDKAKRNII